jgi:hypothetical protein
MGRGVKKKGSKKVKKKMGFKKNLRFNSSFSDR